MKKIVLSPRSIDKCGVFCSSPKCYVLFSVKVSLFYISLTFIFSSFHSIFVVLQLVSASAVDDRWIDPDTPKASRNTGLLPSSGSAHKPIRSNYQLVFSDEFNEDGRTFENGADARWTALEKPDSSNGPLAYYSDTMVNTKNGHLVIKTTNEEPVRWKDWNDKTSSEETFTRWYKSGMVESWNKFCFTGGILELDVQFPGPGTERIPLCLPSLFCVA